MSTVHFTAAPNVINQPQHPEMIFPKYMIQSLYWNQGCKAILKTDNPSYFDNRAKEPYPQISKKMNEGIEVMKANEDKIFTELAQTMESHARKLEAGYRDNLCRAEELACATARLKGLEIKVHQHKQDEFWRNICTSSPGPPLGHSATEALTESPKASSTFASSTLGRMSYQSHDMSDIATTLAAMPKGPLSVSSSCSIGGLKKRRPMKPHRYVYPLSQNHHPLLTRETGRSMLSALALPMTAMVVRNRTSRRTICRTPRALAGTPNTRQPCRPTRL